MSEEEELQELRTALEEQLEEWYEPPIDVPELRHEEYAKYDVAISVQGNCIDDIEKILEEYDD